MIASAVLMLGVAAAWQTIPERGQQTVPRDSFAFFPRQLGDWEQVGTREMLTADVERVLGADDYHQVYFVNPNVEAPVGLFMAWYADQSQGGVHSPEICLPGAGWEIAWLERTDIAEKMNSDIPFSINRAIIQKGELRMMVYYWFQQKDRRIAWDFAAKFWLVVDGIQTGRTDGALIRLTTVIDDNETDAEAEARLANMLDDLLEPLPQFIPNG
jgi:EpsI family protein